MALKSIRGKFLQLNLFSILLCAVLIGSLALWSLSSLQSENARELLCLQARTEGQELDETLLSIQDSVDIFCDLADAGLPSLDTLHDESFLQLFCDETERSMLQIASKTRGVCACYFRIAEGLSRKPMGYFYSVHGDSDGLVREELTDLSQYAPWDTEHVGWYYQPQTAREAIWMAPYYNRNLGLEMISYARPLYRDGVFWGLAGMDIDFSVVLEHVRLMQPYKTGYACLVSDTGRIYYHPEVEAGENIRSLSDELEPLLAYLQAEHDAHEEACFHYHYKGQGKELSVFRLSNGTNLLLTAPRREIKAPMVALFQRIIVTTALLCGIVILFVFSVSNRITRPLDQLTLAAREIAAGNMEVELPEPGSDEVGILTRSLAVTVSSLKQHIAHIYDMAYSDPLTHVKNKTAFDKECLALQEQMTQGSAAFGLLMLDLNSLKALNDRYGHERGDEYLINCCALMCRVFKHSPVFRVGGDEFLIVLRGDDLEHISALIAEFDGRMAGSQSAREPWKRLSIAKGLSVCEPSDTTPEEVLKRADKAMYADKRRMKEAQ